MGYCIDPRNYGPRAATRQPTPVPVGRDTVQTDVSCRPNCWLPGPLAPAAEPYAPPKTHTHAATTLNVFNHLILRRVLNRMLDGTQKSIIRPISLIPHHAAQLYGSGGDKDSPQSAPLKHDPRKLAVCFAVARDESIGVW